MRQRVFLIGDTHFGHRKIITFQAERMHFKTIEEHDEALVENWNRVVRPKDTVWHLGDVLFGRHSFAILGQLNGTKKLVMGNHDQYPTHLYLEHFVKALGAAELAGCILTHVPVHPSQFKRFRANIHGHMHGRKMEDPRYVNVSAEQNGLAPICLDEVLARLPAAVENVTLEPHCNSGSVTVEPAGEAR